MKRAITQVVLCVSLLFSVHLLSAQRLPDVAVPEKYAILFNPDLKTAQFTGEETIDIRVLKPTSSITLNAVELTVSGSVVQNGAEQVLRVAPNPASETIELSCAKPLNTGPAQLKLKFSGSMADKLRGLYLSRTKQRTYATTQFEPTDARRAFPSFDEPAMKATFDVSVVADKNDTAISNGKIIGDKPGPQPGKHVIRFATTPKMSTYLVALIVGDFKCLNGDAEGTPVRVCAVPGREALTQFALDETVGILKFYNRYYGIKYPFGKLDQIAIPDFEAGAMENTAAITYRETALLIGPDASVERKREVAGTIAHEVAHQWFGDLVTMKWWDDIWLNEGFATWMTYKPLAAMHPEWGMEDEAVLSAIHALGTDSLSSTRPIRQQAQTSSEINELFDAIAYDKTAAVLRMIESYIGPEVFRKAINTYLEKHAYANATAEDFWTTIAEVSGKPVDRVMQSYVTQPGVPIVTFAACTNGTQQLTQERFRFATAREAKSQVWSVPVCASGFDCTVLSAPQGQAPKCSSDGRTNLNGAGYYRAAHEPLQAVPQMPPPERTWFADNEWALTYSGRQPVTAFLTAASELAKQGGHGTWSILTSRLEFLSDEVVDKASRPAFEAWVQAMLKPVIAELGWNARPNDTPDQKDIRADVFFALGYAGRDPEALTKAREMAAAYMKDANAVDSSVAPTVLSLAALNGDAALYDQFVAKAESAKTPDEYYRYVGALGDFGNPALLQRTLKLALTKQIRTQDAANVISDVMRNPAGQKIAWEFIHANWPQIKQRTSVWSAAHLVASAAQFCDASLAQQVQQFFTNNKVPAAQRTLQQSVERINECVSFRDKQQPALAQWLAQKGKAASK